MSFKEVHESVATRKRAGNLYDDKRNAKGIAKEIIEEENELSLGGVSRIREEECVGFSEKVFDYTRPFKIQNINMSLGGVKLKCLAVSLKSVVAVTETNTVLRWKFDNEAFEKYEVITIAEKTAQLKQLSKIGGKLADVGGKIGGKIIPRFKKFQTDKKIEKERRKEIERIYFDKSGDFCVLSNNYGHSYYLSYSASTMRLMRRMKGFIIKCIEFDERVQNKPIHDDKVFLFGSEENQIFEGRLEFNEKEGIFLETVPELRIQVKEEKQKNICDIKVHMKKYVSNDKGDRVEQTVVIACSTSSIYFFLGASTTKGPVTFEELFNEYEQQDTFMFALPTAASHLAYTDMNFEYTKQNGTLASCSYIYTNGNMLQYYKFPDRKDQQIVDDSFFRKSNGFNYGKLPNSTPTSLKVEEMPIGIGITQHHYIILHSDSVSVLSQITQQVVHYESLLHVGKILGMVSDVQGIDGDVEKTCYWIYGESKVVKLFICNEVESSWRLYEEKGMYEKAFQLCKKAKSDYLPRIAEIYGDQLFKQEKYVEAAKIYLESSLSFEEVFVKFADHDARVKEGLAEYVRLFLMKNEKELKEFHQVILVNWLAEYWIHKTAALTQKMHSKRETIENAAVLIDEANKAKKYLKKFMEAYDKLLVEELIYELLSSYGELELCLSYALEKKNYQMVLSNYILAERYQEAISVMGSMNNCSEFAHKYSDSLMKTQTKQFIELLKMKVPQFNAAKIMRSLMEIDRESDAFEEGFQFIKFCVKDKRLYDESIVHNIYVFLLSEHKNRQLFTQFMIDQEQLVIKDSSERSAFSTNNGDGKAQCNFDINFAYNLAKAHKFYRAIMSIYGIKRQYEEAVDIAIEQNMIQEGIRYAKLQEDNLMFESRKLWMKLIRHLIDTEKEGPRKIEKIFGVLEQCRYVKIEDLIPDFDGNMPLEVFKGKIEESVRQYQEEIVALRNEIEEKSVKMDELKADLSKISNKHLVITERDVCKICEEQLMEQDFIAYPCAHNVHRECAIEYIKKKQIYNITKLDEIDSLQDKITEFRKNVRSYDRSQLKNSVEFYADIYRTYNKKAKLLDGGAASAKKASKYLINFESDIHKLSLLHKALDQLVCQECPMCGLTLTDLAGKPYQSDSTWDLE